MAITKTEFISRLAEKADIKKIQASNNVDLFLETLIDCLKEEGAVKLHGFGRFEVRTMKERTGRNPMTKEEYIIPGHKKVRFYASETLADRIE